MSDWPPVLLVYGALCVFGAAIVRGYSGFGFSLLSITALSLVLPPAVVVPSMFLLEVARCCSACGSAVRHSRGPIRSGSVSGRSDS